MPTRPTIDELKELLNLKPLPGEGGFYAETYRSEETIPSDHLPERYGIPKSFGTAIYYLLTPDTFSALHRLPTDEIYHFYLGDPVVMLQLFENGKGEIITLGSDITAGHLVQHMVPRGTWQGSFLKPGGEYALLGTTMSPGFDFSDFELGERTTLLTSHPEYTSQIARLIR